MIVHRKLWEEMKEKGITQYALTKQHHISPGQITRIKRNESISTHTIEVFRKILQCQPGDMMVYIPDED